MNGDGIPDVLAAADAWSDVSVFLGDGAGHFATAHDSPVTVGGAPYAIAANDLDRDGRTDVVAARSASNDVVVLQNASTHDVVASPSSTT